ncbi:MAG: hypothetical protein AUH92_05975 [Acidobacteria bacterium 13_1_40CM_4_69_4]|nr:MAG: hypothetical protein AUH92_05975 [Acidobacteria bacterium 13_1_40CM_4_69_4]
MERPGMIVRRTAVLAGALLLGVTCLRGASQVEADPHELYERAREYLADGELRGAASALSRLRTLIAKRPDWDPEGVFINELLPPLQARLSRLQGVARKLDDFTVEALQDLQPPDIKKDISTVRDYTEWATSVIQRLRAARDQIIGAALTDPEERAFLTHTESYERTERLLEIDVLKRMADTAGDDILGLLAGDPELESVLVRFRQLKRDLMQIVAERDQLETDVKKSHEHDEAVLGVLAAVVTDDASLKAHAGDRRPVSVADLFARFLDGEMEALRRRSYATPSERDLLRTNLDRYRRYNDLLHAAGLGADQKGKIEALSKAVEEIPVEGRVFATFPASRPASLVLIGTLVLATLALGWLAVARGRRLASLQDSTVRRVAIVAAEVRSADVDSKAV